MSKLSFELQNRGACPLCHSTARRVFLAFRDIPVVRCGACDFLYSSAVLPEESLKTFYSERYGGSRHMQGQRVNAQINFSAICRLLQTDRIGHFLEVGSGYGFLLKLIRERLGATVAGVELSKEETRYAREELGVPTHCLSLGDAPLAQASFDVVACFEVIEHVPDPVSFLREMARFVRPGGALLVMTDNFECPLVRRLGADFPKWIPHQHVSHFGNATLRASLARVSGMRLEHELSYTPWELYARWLTRLCKRETPADQAFDLKTELASEMTRSYKLFGLRRQVNQIWADLTFRTNLNGALMYLTARRQPA